VTFSYTGPFWTWEDWESELDWMALHGINLALAWVGIEKHLVNLWRGIGFNDTEIWDFFSGPAFQAWNRFGNIQGDWTPDTTTGPSQGLPMEWIDGQFELQKKIVARMVQLGITPILPAFTGFVPRTIQRVRPDAKVLIGSQWSGFGLRYTNDTFLNPSENVQLFTELQRTFIKSQFEAYGNITHVFTLDQYNENTPPFGDIGFLRNLTYNTWQSLKAADPQSTWLMQGWLFFQQETFWTIDRIEAFLGGVTVNSDMLILDLWSESMPQWQRTNSYFGKPWIWCQLHDYGGTLGLYGQIMNVTVNPIEALHNSSSLVGFGLTPEGQEGNQIIYDLLLDQAWSETPIETQAYFKGWVSSRYGGNKIPDQLYTAWDLMRSTVYNNTNSSFTNVEKSILELTPSITGLYNQPFTSITYDPAVLVKVWNLFYRAADFDPPLWDSPTFRYDIVDVTRQVLSNAFTEKYHTFVQSYNSSANYNTSCGGNDLLTLLESLDAVLSTNKHFSLSTWLASARSFAHTANMTAYYEYNARNQITLWGPNGEINGYASKVWGGLVRSYYLPRWKIFLQYLDDHPVDTYNGTELTGDLLNFSQRWQIETWGLSPAESFVVSDDLRTVLGRALVDWPSIFGTSG
jgi:alpha-N-acetylglucosaminidase